MSNWTVPYRLLDTEQNEFLDHHLYDGHNYWISGFPGSGKSTLLMHAARLIRQDHRNASILFVVYTRSLIEMFNAGFKDSGLNGISIETMYEFMRSRGHYEYIFCDEVQDLPASFLSAMRECSDHLIVAGDPNQSIYAVDVKYQQPTVTPAQIPSLIGGNTFELNIVHRISPSIQKAIQRLVPNLNRLASLRNMANHSTQIRICSASSTSHELEYVWREAQKGPRVGETSAILVPNRSAIINTVEDILGQEGKPRWQQVANNWGQPDFANMNRYLQQQGVNLMCVGNGYGNFMQNNKVYIMTYYSAKGLDFDNVFLPGLNQNFYIFHDDDISRAVFMVGMTRSRNNLYITCCGSEHYYLRSFSSDCARIDIEQALKPANAEAVLGF